MLDLATLQREFYDRVTTGMPTESLVAPGVASGELDIYARMYASRLHDTLADDYPKLRVALGEDAFATLVARYVHAHPPRSFTLRDAGLELPEFLRASPTAPAWAAELAALERARVEVFDGRDASVLEQAAVAALGHRLPDLVLAWVPSSVVVRVESAVDELWSAIEDEQPVAAPRREPRVVLVWRRDVSVLHRTLDPDEAELAPLVAIGTRFADVCETLAAIHGDGASQRAAELLLRWLQAAALASPAGS